MKIDKKGLLLLTLLSRDCGYIYEGTEVPEECPACAHPRAYFELLSENY